MIKSQHDVAGIRNTIVVDDVGVGVVIAPSLEVRVAIRQRSGHLVTVGGIATKE